MLRGPRPRCLARQAQVATIFRVLACQVTEGYNSFGVGLGPRVSGLGGSGVSARFGLGSGLSVLFSPGLVSREVLFCSKTSRSSIAPGGKAGTIFPRSQRYMLLQFPFQCRRAVLRPRLCFQDETTICRAYLISVLFNTRHCASRLRDAALHAQHGPDQLHGRIRAGCGISWFS